MENPISVRIFQKKKYGTPALANSPWRTIRSRNVPIPDAMSLCRPTWSSHRNLRLRDLDNNQLTYGRGNSW